MVRINSIGTAVILETLKKEARMSRSTLLCLLVVAMLSLVAFAQEGASTQVSEEGIALGKFIFRPSLELVYEDKDNVFLTPTNEVSDVLYTARATFSLEYPFYENYFRINWTPQWRDYQDHELKENFSNFVDLDLAFDTPSGLEAEFTHHFAQGFLEVNEVDPGMELVYAEEPFTKNETTGDLKYFFTPTDGFGIKARWNDFSYDDPTSLWYDYTTFSGGISYQRYINPLVRMAIGIDSDTFDADDPEGLRDYDRLDYWVQFYGTFSPTVNGSIKLGYEELNFDNASDYNDWEAEANLSWQVWEGQTLTAKVIRRAFPSNYALNTRYTHNQFGLDYEFQLTPRFYGRLMGLIWKNEYEKEMNAKARTDDAWRLSGAVGYHFNPRLSARLQATHEERDSNLDFDYTVNIIQVNLVYGF